MKKLLILVFMLGTILFGESVSQTVKKIKKDYNETNNYKDYRIEEEEIYASEGDVIRKYYRDNELRKVVVEFYAGWGSGTVEYYIKNKKTYLKFFRQYVEVLDTTQEEKFYYNEDEILVRRIDRYGKIYEDEKGLPETVHSVTWADY